MNRVLPVLLVLISIRSTFAQDLSEEKKSVPLNLIPVFPPLQESDFIEVSSIYGYRIHPIKNKKKFHHGIDLIVNKGKPVFATAPGIVKKSLYEKGYGNKIVIAHPGNFKTLYAHLWIKMVKKDEKVLRGQLIGFAGDTGEVTGTHLHYEIWYRDRTINPVIIWKTFVKNHKKA
ncbi:M23 family metallopeptidase [Abyssalbus ytuae]|uniref:M23 family metallopeptidase n=1 Tax=Abyssalbus ytuae TaxID=2926907 RepID=A0A9E6ZMA1_9FLAO|nr:M23 family metallopeptidase [Abyssalbus ytuae]UOB18422.1 M23 family metallopeptidase [Abyssalbus ytuae]